jgi:four helix bundle protein
MKGDDISERLLDFAVRVLRLVQALPKNVAGRHVSGQLVRSGTSAGSNYEEARGAESRADFVHKLAISSKETRESSFWLRLVHRAALVKPDLVTSLIREAEELSAILAKSLSTARRNLAAKTWQRSFSVVHSPFFILHLSCYDHESS